MKIHVFLIIISIITNCLAGPFSTGKTSDKPLRVPEDVEDLDRFLLQMTLRTILMDDEEVEDIIKNTVDPDFREAWKMLFVSTRNILGQSKEEIVESLAHKGSPKNEFEAQRRSNAESDNKSLISGVIQINYLSIDISALVKNSEYEFDKGGFTLKKDVYEKKLTEASIVDKRLPNWIYGGHDSNSFIKINSDLAEKWREDGGILRCVYRYTMSGPKQLGVYPLRGKSIRYEFVDRLSSVIVSVPSANISPIIDINSVEYPMKIDRRKGQLSSFFPMLCLISIIFVGLAVYKLHNKFP